MPCLLRFRSSFAAVLFGLGTAIFAAGCASESDSSNESSASANFTEGLQGDVRMILDITGAQATYESDGAGGYKQATATRTVNQKIVGSGVLASLNKDKREVDTSVAGISTEGHSKVELRAVPGQPNMVTVVADRLIKVSEGELKVEQKFSYEAEATFTAGNFEAFTRGEDVEIVLTKKGQEALDAANKTNFANAMRSLRDQLKAQLGDSATASDINLEQFQATGRTVINGNSKKLDVVTASMNVTLQFSVTIRT